jgi:hypothetical protein
VHVRPECDEARWQLGQPVMNLRDCRDSRGDAVQQKPRFGWRIALAGLSNGIGLKPDEPAQKLKAVCDPVVGFGACIVGGETGGAIHGRLLSFSSLGLSEKHFNKKHSNISDLSY